MKHNTTLSPTSPLTSCVADNEPEAFAPLAAFQALQKKAGEGHSAKRPKRVRIAALTQYPNLFQARGMDERHVQELRRALRGSRDLEPILVVQAGEETVLLDGHHRLAAYRCEKKPSLPVRWFKGTLSEAVLEVGRANCKAKLPMTSQERQDFAWRLVLMEQHSKKMISQASGVSLRQVGNMRRVRRVLEEEAYEYRSWWRALQSANNATRDLLTDEEREEWIEAQAEAYADRLAKAFGKKLTDNIPLAGLALERYFGRRLGELLWELEEHLEAYKHQRAVEDEDCDF